MKKRYVFIVCFLLITLAFLWGNNQYVIEIKNKQHPSISIPVKDKFSILYIHSSEKQPWENIFQINRDETYTLKTIKVSSLGPGVPYNVEEGWKFYIKDGYFIYDNVDENFDNIDIKLSNISPHYIKSEGKLYNLVELCGDDSDIKISVRKGLIPNSRRFLSWKILR